MDFKFSQLEDVFFCTGARNHDLLSDIRRPIFELDERIASFKALGAVKISLLPCAVCTTSGTAVAECLPAMLEAYYSNLPLVLITGDRPSKQHGTGAPQTICHEELTRSCRRSFYEIKAEDLKGFEIHEAEFPIHINVIVDDTLSHDEKIQVKETLDNFNDFLLSHPRPLFLFSHEERSLRPLIERFLRTGLPFYAETLSGGHDLSPISNETKLLELFRSQAFDAVVRVGHTPLSKIWRLMETKITPVWSFDSRGLSALSYGKVTKKSGDEILNDDGWWSAVNGLKPWILENSSNTKKLKELCERYPVSEIALMARIQESLPEDAIVYLGNSLVIRNFETVQTKRLRVHGNRGVNGIDGQLSTVIGMAQKTSETIYCILGDLTLRYDLSALSEFPSNLRLIVINNYGGRIFESLNLDERIILAHKNNFSSFAQVFGLSYSTKMEDVKFAQITEVFTDLEESRSLLRELRP